MSTTVKICGAAQMVTGSCLLVETPRTKFLVDCGLFQGPKTVKSLNYGAFPFKPQEIAFVLLTHAHIDHSGLLPKLVREGFGGAIYATPGTIDLCSCMLPDSARIQETEVEELNRRNRRRGRPEVRPIYGTADAAAAQRAFKAVEYEAWAAPAPGIRARYWNAGHILGSASIEIEIDGEGAGGKPLRILASGDIGPENKLLQPDPRAPAGFDYIFCEATYGAVSRPHPSPEQRRQHLAEEVNEAARQKGALVIPAFAVERTQELLSDLLSLVEAGQIPPAPIFLDSPLAIRTTEVFLEHADELEDGAALRKQLQLPFLHSAETADQSRAIEQMGGFHIIIAASGMCDAGRIRHHLRHWLWNERGTVLLVGYQAIGTLGRLLQEGVKAVRIQGEEVKVRARIRTMDDYSGHAGGEGLLRWLKARQPLRSGLFLVHAEEKNLSGLAARVLEERIVKAENLVQPALDDVYELAAPAPKLLAAAAARRIEPAAVAELDWHNKWSALLLRINERLNAAADNKTRENLLERLRRAFDQNG